MEAPSFPRSGKAPPHHAVEHAIHVGGPLCSPSCHQCHAHCSSGHRHSLRSNVTALQVPQLIARPLMLNTSDLLFNYYGFWFFYMREACTFFLEVLDHKSAFVASRQA